MGEHGRGDGRILCRHISRGTYSTNIKISYYCSLLLGLGGVGEGILIGANTSGFESFRGELFVFIGDHVHAEGKFVDIGSLAAQIEDTDLGIGDTAVET